MKHPTRASRDPSASGQWPSSRPAAVLPIASNPEYEAASTQLTDLLVADDTN